MKNGKLPLSAKTAPKSNLFAEKFGNRLAIPEAVQNEIDSQNLAARWVAANTLAANNGYHKNGWVAYKSKGTNVGDFRFGTDPEGVIRRGSMILAVRPMEIHESHKEFLAERAQAPIGKDRKAHQRQAAKELRKMAQDSGINTVIEEGDEDND